MRRFFGKVENNVAIIDGDEFIHLKTVLRGKIGEYIIVYNMSENEYICEIQKINKNDAICLVKEINLCRGLPNKNIVLFQALIKRDKMEEVIVKSVEIGVSKLISFESEYCTVKQNENKKERLEKIVISSCKQCERSIPMEVGESLSFKALLKEIKSFNNTEKSIVLFANERSGEPFDFSTLKDKENIAIVIGPEGGFSDKEKEELASIAESITLGKRILRSETASLVLCALASVHSGN